MAMHDLRRPDLLGLKPSSSVASLHHPSPPAPHCFPIAIAVVNSKRGRAPSGSSLPSWAACVPVSQSQSGWQSGWVVSRWCLGGVSVAIWVVISVDADADADDDNDDDDDDDDG